MRSSPDLVSPLTYGINGNLTRQEILSPLTSSVYPNMDSDLRTHISTK